MVVVKKEVPRWKQLILAAAIMIVLAFFVNYSLSVIYEEPKFETYCVGDYKNFNDKLSCEANGGKWNDPNAPVEAASPIASPMAVPTKFAPRECPGLCSFTVGQDVCAQANLSTCQINDVVFEADCQQKGGTFFPSADCPTASKIAQGYCDSQYVCRTKFESANNIYRRNIFITQMVIGAILLFVGIMLNLPSVSGGIMSGAVVTMFVALTGYWGDLNKWLRIIILAVILIILIWMGYKKLQK